VTNSRKALCESQDDLRAAEKRLVFAQLSTGAAREYVAAAEAVVKGLQDKQANLSASQTIMLVESLKAGKKPAALEEVTRMVELDHALSNADMARQALAAIEGEERDAEKVVAAAKAKVAKAIKAVLFEEAFQIAGRLETLEAETLDLRARIGMQHGFLGTQLHPVGERLSKIILKTEVMDEIAIKNMPMNLKAGSHIKVWEKFAKALEADPKAVLSF